MSDRSSICCCLILLGYPFLAIGVSTAVMAVGTSTLHILRRACHLRTPYTGLLTSAWAAADTLAKIGGAIVLIVPVCMIPLFLWTQRPLLKQLLARLRQARHPTPRLSRSRALNRTGVFLSNLPLLVIPRPVTIDCATRQKLSWSPSSLFFIGSIMVVDTVASILRSFVSFDADAQPADCSPTIVALTCRFHPSGDPWRRQKTRTLHQRKGAIASLCDIARPSRSQRVYLRRTPNEERGNGKGRGGGKTC